MKRDFLPNRRDSLCSEEDLSHAVGVMRKFDTKKLKKQQVIELLAKSPAIITRLVEVQTPEADEMLRKIISNVIKEDRIFYMILHQIIALQRDDFLQELILNFRLMRNAVVLKVLVESRKWSLLQALCAEELVPLLSFLEGQFEHDYLNTIHGDDSYQRLVGEKGKATAEHVCGVVHYLLTRCDVEALQHLSELGLNLFVTDDAGVTAFRFLIELSRTGYAEHEPDDFLPLFDLFIQRKVAEPQQEIAYDVARLRALHHQMADEMLLQLRAIKFKLDQNVHVVTQHEPTSYDPEQYQSAQIEFGI